MPRTIGSVEGEAEVEHDVEDETKKDLVVRPAQRPGHRRLIAIGEDRGGGQRCNGHGDGRGARYIQTAEVHRTCLTECLNEVINLTRMEMWLLYSS